MELATRASGNAEGLDALSPLTLSIGQWWTGWCHLVSKLGREQREIISDAQSFTSRSASISGIG